METKLSAILDDVQSGHDLAHYAAYDALKVLFENWSADGNYHADDIRQVREILRNVQSRVSV